MSRVCVFVVFVAAVLPQLLLAHTHSSPFDFLRHERATVNIEKDAVIAATPTLLQHSGDWVTVSWSGVSSPSNSDWIGVYSPPLKNGSIDPVNHAPIKFQYANVSGSHMPEGKGSLKFRLVNMRADVVFGFLRGGFDDPTLAAVSGPVKFQNQNEPLQGHLALTNDISEMLLVWVTDSVSSPMVKWGTTSGQYSHMKNAISSNYTEKDMCGEPATGFGYRPAGLIHQVTITNLSPGVRYYYTYGDGVGGWSEEFSFVAAPKPGPSVTTRVVAFGDMGVGQVDDSRQLLPPEQPSLNTTKLVTQEVNSGFADLVLHIGDICYARGYASVWDEFFDQIQPIATRVPYMVCIGNHERDFPNSGSLFNSRDSGGECGVPYEKRLLMPRPSMDEAWYALDYGSIHFILMSTEHEFSQNSTQFLYLSSHLQKVDRSVTPWLVFIGHRPMYIDSTNNMPDTGDQTVAKLLRESLEDLLVESKVDLALWGHHHSYQRTCRVYREACVDEGGVIHVVIGMAGAGLSQNIETKAPDWIKVVDDQHWGYSRITSNATTLMMEYVRNNDGLVHDTFYLEKSP